jgi:protein-tyrosine-phosphatase
MKSVVKRWLPESMRREWRQFRSYRSAERALYFKLRFLRGTKMASSLRPRPGARSFLFVCYGNIMRSPMCEALMNRALADSPHSGIFVRSAGLNAVPGRTAHPWALAAAKQFGIHLQEHRAKMLSREMVDQAEVIFVMDYQNQVQLLTRHPHAASKVYLLSCFAGKGYGSAEIPDPYYLGEEATRQCYGTLNACISNLIESLA